jgi:hypothetical protein
MLFHINRGSFYFIFSLFEFAENDIKRNNVVIKSYYQ